jgi:hypothetical protein
MSITFEYVSRDELTPAQRIAQDRMWKRLLTPRRSEPEQTQVVKSDDKTE